MTTKGTQLLAQIARGDADAIAWMDEYIASLKQLAQVSPSVPVYATIDHEMKAKARQGLITGESAKPEVYGKALNVFLQRAKKAHPNIHTTYWMVGYDREFEGTVGKQFTTLPDVIAFDPYANSAGETFDSITKSDLAWIRAQSWYQGQPIALAEFGMPVSNGDAALAKFFTGARSEFARLGIAWGVFFNRPRTATTSSQRVATKPR